LERFLKKIFETLCCQVRGAVAEDSGEYYCIVKSGEDEVHSMIATVQVTAGNDDKKRCVVFFF
jgi:hypothetical protein